MKLKKVLAHILTALLLTSLIACDNQVFDDGFYDDYYNDDWGDTSDGEFPNAEGETDIFADKQLCTQHQYVDNYCSVCNCSLWNGDVDTSWYSAIETQLNISTAAQLAGLSELVNSGNGLEGITVTLGANIDLNHLNWSPIGFSWEHVFAGVFDGNGYTIANVKAQGGADVGFFGQSTGEIKNLCIKDLSILCNSSQPLNVGGLVGYNKGKVNSCHVNVNMNVQGCGGSIGGLIGYNEGDCEGCSVNGTIAFSENQPRGTYENIYLGGLVGNHYDSALKRNYFVGTIICNATREDENLNCSVIIGGLIGEAKASNKVNYKGTVIVENNYCEADITANTSNVHLTVGGFAGNLFNSHYMYVKNSYAISTINAEAALPDGHNWMSADAKASGFVGNVPGWDDIVMSNCWVDTNITLKTKNLTGYASYLCSEFYDDRECKNSFYSSDGHLDADKVVNYIGTPVKSSDFKNIDLYNNRFDWDAEIWLIVDGEYPKLR